MSQAKINAILPYFGGKRAMASTIVEELGAHTAYWEPFCGSLAVLLGKPISVHETVNDLHDDVVNLARVVAEEETAVQLYDKLQRTICSEELFTEAQARYADTRRQPYDRPCVDRAYLFFVINWIGRNGVSGTARINYQMAVRWTAGGGGGGARFRNAVDSLPIWHQRLRQVTILNRSAFEILEKIDDAGEIAIYVDPPYLPETRSSARYEHEFSAADHARLADLLGRFKRSRVVVSYYAHPRLAELYPGWTVRQCNRHKNLHVQNRRGSAKSDAPEVLIINGRSYATDHAAGTLF